MNGNRKGLGGWAAFLAVLILASFLPATAAAQVPSPGLTLSGPESLALSETGTYSGHLTLAGEGVPGQQILIYKDGEVTDYAMTNETGAYKFDMNFQPATVHTLQTQAYPYTPLEAHSDLLRITVWEYRIES